MLKPSPFVELSNRARTAVREPAPPRSEADIRSRLAEIGIDGENVEILPRPSRGGLAFMVEIVTNLGTIPVMVMST